MEDPKRALTVRLLVGLIILGLVVTYSSVVILSGQTSLRPTPTASTQTVSLPGKDNIDSLTLLRDSHQVELQGETIIGIDQIKPGPNQRWVIYKNNQKQTAKPAEIKTGNSDTIDWKLE